MKKNDFILRGIARLFHRVGNLFLCCCLMVVLIRPGAGAGAEGEVKPDGAAESDTLLMFVGESLDVLSIATRREESAWQVPAVAHVVTREQIRERGVSTLGEALALVPGFHMAGRESGTQAYMRGVSNSILCLYDTVPMGSEVSKSLQFLDREMSLESVKRIEIVSGPGSVLWGPDAFAGVVNIVPLTGRDVQGGEVGGYFGEPGHPVGAYANAGFLSGNWDAFFSVSAHHQQQEEDGDVNVVRFWGDLEEAVPPENRYGTASVGDSQYVEAAGRVSHGERFSLSGRISDYRHPYALAEQGGDYTWRETERVPSGFLKLESKQRLDFRSALRFTASYSMLNPEYDIIDRTIEQNENSFYTELIFDHTLMAGRGLLTAGASYRDRRVDDALIWDGYLPDYLGPENENLLPELDQVDYHTRLVSVFGQYVHKMGPVDILLGLRNDAHDEYDDAVSYNTGLVWSPNRQWVVKLFHGTAFRTPYASQLREEDELEPEKITNLSAQVAWKPSMVLDMSLCGFNNRIANHVMEDPYAGLSSPNTQTINGLEFETRLHPHDTLDVELNFTVLSNSGPDEKYLYNDYDFIRPDGSVEKHYVELVYPYDLGPDRLFNLIGTWRPVQRFSTTGILRYISARDLIHPREEAVITCKEAWLLDWNATVHRFVIPSMELTLSVRNLLDREYTQPGQYRVIEGPPRTVQVMLRYKW
ncbi:MAG: TonB-dependent receptor plug domain-containing protein [Thermodesulfobacteriota bacterium]